MTFVTVFRHIPRPITGMIGIVQGPNFERFEANLEWLGCTVFNTVAPGTDLKGVLVRAM